MFKRSFFDRFSLSLASLYKNSEILDRFYTIISIQKALFFINLLRFLIGQSFLS
jgi:hypothetical protein